MKSTSIILVLFPGLLYSNTTVGQNPASATDPDPVVLSSSVSCSYTGSNQSIPYATIFSTSGSNGTLANTLWDETSFPNSVFFGSNFRFRFNGTLFTTCNVNANGYIWFGTGSAPASGITDVLSVATLGTGNAGVIAACGRDLNENPSLAAAPIPDNGGFGARAVRYQTFGTAPNRYCVIEFIGFYPKLTCAAGGADNHRLDFQFRLYEDGGTFGNRIELVYRDQTPFCNDKAYSFQAGVRGVNPTDFVCRKQSGGNFTSSSSSAGTANTDKIIFAAGDHIAGTDVGIRFDYTPIPAPAITQSNDTLYGPPGYSSYQWYFGGNLIPGATNSFYVATQNGQYTLTVTDLNGCQASSGIVHVITGINHLTTSHLQLTISPIPIRSSFMLQLYPPVIKAEIFIYDVLGKEMVRKKLSGDRMEIESRVLGMESGVYFVRVSGEEKQWVQKIIVE